jgi:hypothetical protein
VIAYLFAPYLFRPRRLRSIRPVRAAVASLVRGDDVAGVKLAAIAAYESQWQFFQHTLGDWREALEGYAQLLHEEGVIERVWRVVQIDAVTR